MRTFKINLKLNKLDRSVLTDMCHCSKNLYNVALYYQRQQYSETKKYVKYESLDKIIRETKPKHYKKLNSVASQNVLKELDQAYKSFFALLKLFQSGKIKNYPKPPKYKKDLGLNVISLNNRSFNIRNGFIEISVSKYHKNRYKISKIFIPYCGPILKENVNTIDIKPLGFGKFELHLKYEEKAATKVEGNDSMSIDLGLNNLCSMITTKGDALLVSGKQLKSINAYWNKQIAKINSEISQNKGYKKLRLIEIKKNITIKRNRTVTDVLHKISHNIISYALNNNILEIIIGHNIEWKKEINIGRVNNQKFVNIPHSKLIEYIKYKGKAHGISIVTREESYTSKCDSLALEPIQKHEKYLGRRTKRGYFKSSTNKTINADINGAINIYRKHIKSNGEFEIISKITAKGLVFRPRKTDWGKNPNSPKLNSQVPDMLGTLRKSN